MNGKSRIWALALLFGVLLLGGAAGATANRLVAGDDACTVADSKRERGRHLDHLATELDLSEDQRAQAERTIERHREQMSALWREMRPRFEEMKTQLRSEIRAGLTEEQQARYDALLESQPERWRHKKSRNR